MGKDSKTRVKHHQYPARTDQNPKAQFVQMSKNLLPADWSKDSSVIKRYRYPDRILFETSLKSS